MRVVAHVLEEQIMSCGVSTTHCSSESDAEAVSTAVYYSSSTSVHLSLIHEVVYPHGRGDSVFQRIS